MKRFKIAIPLFDESLCVWVGDITECQNDIDRKYPDGEYRETTPIGAEAYTFVNSSTTEWIIGMVFSERVYGRWRADRWWRVPVSHTQHWRCGLQRAQLMPERMKGKCNSRFA